MPVAPELTVAAVVEATEEDESLSTVEDAAEENA